MRAAIGSRFPDPAVAGLDPLENRFQRAGAPLQFLKAVKQITSLLVVLTKLSLELLAFRSQIAKRLGLSLLPPDQLEQSGLERLRVFLDMVQLVPPLFFFRCEAIDVLQQPLDLGVPTRVAKNSQPRVLEHEEAAHKRSNGPDQERRQLIRPMKSLDQFIKAGEVHQRASIGPGLRSRTIFPNRPAG